jgi:hypothetical protein
MYRTRPARPWAVLAVLFLALASAVTLAEDQDAKKKKKQPPSANEAGQAAQAGAAKPAYDVKKDDVITNDDLELMMAGLTPLEARTGVYQAEAKPEEAATPGVEGAPAAPAPGAAPAAAKSSSPGQQRTDAQGKVAALQARVSELEKAVLAVKNPLLPRTWTTPDSMKDQDEQSGYSTLENTERLAQREAELRAARDELSQARQELAGLGGNEDAHDDAP